MGDRSMRLRTLSSALLTLLLFAACSTPTPATIFPTATVVPERTAASPPTATHPPNTPTPEPTLLPPTSTAVPHPPLTPDGPYFVYMKGEDANPSLIMMDAD